jgi:hypothetical protein
MVGKLFAACLYIVETSISLSKSSVEEIEEGEKFLCHGRTVARSATARSATDQPLSHSLN